MEVWKGTVAFSSSWPGAGHLTEHCLLVLLFLGWSLFPSRLSLWRRGSQLISMVFRSWLPLSQHSETQLALVGSHAHPGWIPASKGLYDRPVWNTHPHWDWRGHMPQNLLRQGWAWALCRGIGMGAGQAQAHGHQSALNVFGVLEEWLNQQIIYLYESRRGSSELALVTDSLGLSQSRICYQLSNVTSSRFSHL